MTLTQHIGRYSRWMAACATSLAVAACAPEPSDDVAPAPSAGEVDLSNYVAVGTSLTAGYGDGALYRSGQLYSLPNILAGQFAQAGGGSFEQPLLTEGSGIGVNPASGTANGRFALVVTPQGLFPNQSVPSQYGAAPAAIGQFLADQAGVPTPRTELNNWGVPGLRIAQLNDPNLGNVALLGNPATAVAVNPYYARHATAQDGSTTLLADVLQTSPTFVTYELGSNDVLGYALTGGSANGVLVQPATLGALSTGLTNGAGAILASAPEAKMLMVQVPDVTVIPYFTTVGPQAVALAQSLNVPLSTQFFYVREGGTLAQATLQSLADPFADDAPLILLPAAATLQSYLDDGNDNGIPDLFDGTNPLPDNLILDPVERDSVANAVSTYNNAIDAFAAANNDRVAVLRTPEFLSQFRFNGTTLQGSTYGGVNTDSRYVSGGLFALDGVHLTPRGYALAANAMIEIINRKWNARIPAVSPTSYPTVILPN